MADYYQLKISMKGIKPVIWRVLVVESHTLLPDLHKMIQTLMGWTNSHMHQFFINGKFYGSADLEDLYLDDSEQYDYQDVRLNSFIRSTNDSFIYEYDFGDGWVMDIKPERIFDDKPEYPLPHCLDGKMNSPPEDVGGVPGFYAMRDALKKHPYDEEHQAYVEWLGLEYDPKLFDLKAINELLQRDNFGCLELS